MVNAVPKYELIEFVLIPLSVSTHPSCQNHGGALCITAAPGGSQWCTVPILGPLWGDACTQGQLPHAHFRSLCMHKTEPRNAI